MTKEEIFGLNWTDGDQLDLTHVYKSMDEYATQQSIEFMNWVLKQGWNLFGDVDGRFWRLYSESKTTEELYELFTQSKQQ